MVHRVWTPIAARWLVAAAALFVTVMSAGCGGPPTPVTARGSILQGERPIAVGPTGVVQVTLVPDSAKEYTTYLGRCNESGAFEIVEVPPGNYKICIEVLDPTPQDDKLQGAYSMHNTKIIREIDGKTPVVVDLAKPDK